MTQEFFNKTYESVSKGLLEDHQVLFALRLVFIRLNNDEKFDKIFNQMLKPTTILDSKLNPSMCGGKLATTQLASLEEL